MSKYNIMYVYDIIPKNPSHIHKIKRRFYYHLNKNTPFIRKATKSVILTTSQHEKHIDEFFMSFSEDIIVYKCKITDIEIFKNPSENK